MGIQRMDHVGIVVDDLADAVAFFAELGLELRGEAEIEDERAGRIIGLPGARSRIAMLRTPDGHSQIELTMFHTPADGGGVERAPANARGIRHIAFAVDDVEEVLARLQARGAELVGELVRYGDSYKLCYVRGPGGVILELAEPLG